MRVGVPKETTAGERRVALVPETVGRLSGFDVVVFVFEEHEARATASTSVAAAGSASEDSFMRILQGD